MSIPYIMFCLDQTLVNLYRPHIPLNLNCSQTWQELNEQSLQTHTHTYTHRHDSAIKMNEILLFLEIQVDLDGLMPSEVKQAEKYKYCTFSLICGI